MSLVLSCWIESPLLAATVTDHRIEMHLRWNAGTPASFKKTQLAWPRLTRREAWTGFAFGLPRARGSFVPPELRIEGPPLGFAFVSLPLTFALIGFVFMRRIRRRRSNRCVKCGYPLAGLQVPLCPECGPIGPREQPTPQNSPCPTPPGS